MLFENIKNAYQSVKITTTTLFEIISIQMKRKYENNSLFYKSMSIPTPNTTFKPDHIQHPLPIIPPPPKQPPTNHTKSTP